MEDLEFVANVVRRAATSGARSVSNRMQIVEDAVLMTVERWEEAVLNGKEIAKVSSWASRVAANAAKRLLTVRMRRTIHAHDDEASAAASRDEAPDKGGLGGEYRKTLAANLERRKNRLRGKQYDVLRKMASRGMTQAKAAKELGMDRANLRRAFRSGLKRLRGDEGK